MNKICVKMMVMTTRMRRILRRRRIIDMMVIMLMKRWRMTIQHSSYVSCLRGNVNVYRRSSETCTTDVNKACGKSKVFIERFRNMSHVCN